MFDDARRAVRERQVFGHDWFMTAVDLNADLGESFGAWRMGDDEALLDVLTSANVACGFHAGDPLTMQKTCEAAAARGVVVGAHPSYPDLVGFGRRQLDMSPAELTSATLYQLGALRGICEAAGARLAYVKPHGALYHAVSASEELAEALVSAVVACGRLAVLGPAGSALLRAAKDAGLQTAAEVFADRGYLPDGRLVPRGEPGAILTDPAEVAARVVGMAKHSQVAAVDGSIVPLQVDSICLHSDTPGAVTLARSVRDALVKAGINIRAFA